MADQFDVIYLTGAPAAGKSSLAGRLGQVISPIKVFNYGQELTEYLAAKSGSPYHQDELRRQSAQVITPEDVEALDSILLNLTALSRVPTAPRQLGEFDAQRV
jgi:adenylate kinase